MPTPISPIVRTMCQVRSCSSANVPKAAAATNDPIGSTTRSPTRRAIARAIGGDSSVATAMGS